MEDTPSPAVPRAFRSYPGRIPAGALFVHQGKKEEKRKKSIRAKVTVVLVEIR